MVTVYITITTLVFWLGLAVQGDIVTNMSVYEWISTFILYTIIPIAMILSYIVTAGDTFYKFETHHKTNYWLICLYPTLYLICILIRGYIRHSDHQPDNTLFPYFFLLPKFLYNKWFCFISCWFSVNFYLMYFISIFLYLN